MNTQINSRILNILSYACIKVSSLQSNASLIKNKLLTSIGLIVLAIDMDTCTVGAQIVITFHKESEGHLRGLKKEVHRLLLARACTSLNYG